MYITYISVVRRISKFSLRNTHTRMINTRKCTPSLFHIMLMILVIFVLQIRVNVAEEERRKIT